MLQLGIERLIVMYLNTLLFLIGNLGGKVVKTRMLLVLMILLLFINYGCTQGYKQHDIKNQTTNPIGNEISPLNVFGKASVLAKVSDRFIKENNIAMKATIEKIIDYSKFESQEALLKNGDIIIIEFSGIGDKNEWKAANITTGDMIKVELRCLDGRDNSLKPFTKNDCYWEGTDETVSIT